jgi:hypothetical protein
VEGSSWRAIAATIHWAQQAPMGNGSHGKNIHQKYYKFKIKKKKKKKKRNLARKS